VVDKPSGGASFSTTRVTLERCVQSNDELDEVPGFDPAAPNVGQDLAR